MLINKERPSNDGHTYKVDMLINSSLKKPLVVEVGDDIAIIRNIIYYKHCYWYNSKNDYSYSELPLCKMAVFMILLCIESTRN